MENTSFKIKIYLFFMGIKICLCIPIYAVAKRAGGSLPLKLENIFSYRLCFPPFQSKEKGKDGRLFGRPVREKEISFSWQLALFVMIPLLDQEYCGKIVGESELF